MGSSKRNIESKNEHAPSNLDGSSEASAAKGRKGLHEKAIANNPVDQHVGRRVRERRLLLGLSQSAVAQQIGVTGQQYQKYERSENRISASRLFDLGNILKVNISYFFDGLTDESKATSQEQTLSGATSHEVELSTTSSTYSQRQAYELQRLWQQLPVHARERVVDLVRSMVDLSSN